MITENEIKVLCDSAFRTEAVKKLYFDNVWRTPKSNGLY